MPAPHSRTPFFSVRRPRLRRLRREQSAGPPGGGPGGPVSRVLSWERHSSGTHITVRLKRPTRWLDRADPHFSRSTPAYLVLLRGGFTMPVLLPVRRWALTPPFHPCLIPSRGHRRSALCCTFRRVAPPRSYLAHCPGEPGLSSAVARGDALVHPSTVPDRRRLTKTVVRLDFIMFLFILSQTCLHPPVGAAGLDARA